MSIPQILASYGRRGDNNLVHVSDRELRGIENLTGRKFTRNPHTGLPEAFGFEDLLPIAAGVIGTVVGTPAVGALAAGATRAAVSGAQGKETGAALMDGLITGATSYAGSGLMEGVGAGLGETVGANAGQITPFGAAVDAGTNVGASVGGAADAAGAVAAPSLQGMTAGEAMASLPAEPTYATTGAQELQLPLPPPPTPEAPPLSFGQNVSNNIDGFTGRMSGILQDPMGAASQLGSNIQASPLKALTVGAGLYNTFSGLGSPTGMPQGAPSEYDPSKRITNRSGPREVNMPGPDYRPGIDPEYRYFSRGGIAELPIDGAPHYNASSNLVSEGHAAMLGEHPARGDVMRRLQKQMGSSGVRSARDQAGRVRGAGGGLDDLVPGTIEGRQRVRLADGEFVIPADVVSALGDGSTDQGSRILQEMMSTIRKKKTGSTKQPGRLSRGALPA